MRTQSRTPNPVRVIAPGDDPLARRQRDRHGDDLGRVVAAPRCHIYLRVSSPDQDLDRGPDGRRVRVRRSKDERDHDVKRSLDTQEAEARAYAQRMGYAVVAVYRETFTSFEFWDRPELGAIRKAIVRREVDVLVCLKMERLGATSIQLAVLENLLEQHGGRLEFVQQTFEPGPMGRIGKAVFSEFNTWRLENLREQFTRAKGARVQAGRPLHGSRPPYGCAWADDTRTAYRWVEPEATHVRDLFDRYAAGWSRRRIARWLNGRGIPPPGGGRGWYDRTVQVILENPRYAGRPAAYRYRVEPQPGATAGGHRRRVTRLREPDHDRPPVALPPTRDGDAGPGGPLPVPEDVWERVQARLAAPDAPDRGGRPPRDPVAWLLRGGYVRCGECERPLIAHRAGPYDVYACRANTHGVKRCRRPVAVLKTLVEARVWARVLEQAERPDHVEDVLRAYVASRDDDGRAAQEARAAAVRATLGDVRREADGLAPELGRVGEWARVSIRRQLDDLGARAEALEADLRAIEADLATSDRAEQEALDFVGALRRVGARLADPAVADDPAFRRLAVEALSPVAFVYPAPSGGRGARARRIPVEFPVEATRYAALEAALAAGAGGTPDGDSSPGDGGADGLWATANGQLWRFAVPISPVPAAPGAPAPGVLRLRFGADGALGVA